MSRAQELLDAATPLPWSKDSDFFFAEGTQIGHTGECGAAWGHAPWGDNARLIVYAVNTLPAHEAAREAATELVWRHDNVHGIEEAQYIRLRAALARLRDEVPALTPDQERMVEEQLSDV